MQLFLDLFGYLSVLLRGLGLIVQSVGIGSLAFLLLIARPLAKGDASRQPVLRSAILILRIAGWTVAILAVLRLAVQLAALIAASGIALHRALGANFVVALSLQAACGIALALLAGRATRPGSHLPLALCCAGILAGALTTSHATGRLEGRGWLLMATILHQLGAGVWIGGLPALLVALALLKDGDALAFLGRRYSMMAVCSVGALLAGAAILVVKLIGSGQALYGTAYGFMTMTKMA
jgi:copper resistance protein D